MGEMPTCFRMLPQVASAAANVASTAFAPLDRRHTNVVPGNALLVGHEPSTCQMDLSYRDL